MLGLTTASLAASLIPFLAAGMADLEGFHGINFFVSFTNLLLGFLLVEFSGIYRVLLVLVLVDAQKWWSDKQQNQE